MISQLIKLKYGHIWLHKAWSKKFSGNSVFKAQHMIGKFYEYVSSLSDLSHWLSHL